MNPKSESPGQSNQPHLKFCGHSNSENPPQFYSKRIIEEVEHSVSCKF